jgi:mannose/fructose/N-acetylgalactosamine-specific phosphotransferase system component IIC
VKLNLILAWFYDFAPLVLCDLINFICPALQTGLIYFAPLALAWLIKYFVGNKK